MRDRPGTAVLKSQGAEKQPMSLVSKTRSSPSGTVTTSEPNGCVKR